MINIDIYESKINIILLDSVEDSEVYIKKFNKKYKTNHEVYSFEGCVFVLPNRVYNLVFVKPFINTNLLSHECFHLTSLVSDSCDVTDTGNREERSYLNGFINQKVRNYLVDKKKLLIL